MLAYFANEVVLGFSPAPVWRVDLIKCGDAVLLIREFNPTGNQVD